MRVLVTRPADDADRTAQALKDRGHEALVAPLFDVSDLAGPDLVLDDVQAILVTSANGLRALARRSERRDLPIFAVGTHTADCARANGFLRVVDAAGDASALAASVCERLAPARGPLIHVVGTNASRELGEHLETAGFEVRVCALYEIVAASHLPDAAAAALRGGALDAALFFSPRSALAFTDCMRRADLATQCRALVACCISSATADALEGIAFKEVRTAARPDQESVIALLHALPG